MVGTVLTLMGRRRSATLGMDQMDPDFDGLSRDGPTPSVTRRGKAGVDHHGSDIFFAAIETTRMPMVLSDPNQPDNPIVFANRAFVHMTGYGRSEIVGRNCRFLQGPESDPDTVDRIRHAVRARCEIAVELLNYRRDGTSFWNALFISPVFDTGGDLVYFFASQLDVSRRRDAEEALRRLRKMEAVGQLTGGIAHDFNNLLQVITGYMDGLKVHAAASDDARLIRRVGAISEAADRATALTQRLLALSREQKRDGRTVNLNVLVSGLRETMRRTLDDAVAIETALDDALWNSHLDPSRAETALLDLVANARNAMPDGGTVRIETANVDVGSAHELTAGGLRPGRYAMVAISDTGTGMSEDLLKRVTDSFRTNEGQGRDTGLGLSMVHGFAEQSGGAVRLRSEVGRGTTVRLYFPAVAAGERAARPGARGTMDRGGGERILVVDDRAEVAELARTMLEDAGYAVEVAKDGQDALAKLRSGFDLLFSDLVMPGGLDGVALAREAQRRHPGLRVLLTTGDADAALERTDAGGTEFDTIAKPYRRSELARTVRAVLDGPAGVR